MSSHPPRPTLPRSQSVALVLTWTLGLLTIPACSSLMTTDSTLDESQRVEKQRTAATVHHSSSSRSSRQAIALGVEFLRLENERLGASLWDQIDETAFTSATRSAWLANGLRIGILLDESTLPTSATNTIMLDPAEALMRATGVASSGPSGKDRVNLLPGKRHELPVCSIQSGPTVVLAKHQGRVDGRTLDSPQAVLVIQATGGPRERQATLQIWPEIQHGPLRQQFITGDAALRMASGRERWNLADLNVAWTTDVGGVLVIAPVYDEVSDEPVFGFGRQFLREDDPLHPDQSLVLLLRLEGVPESTL